VVVGTAIAGPIGGIAGGITTAGLELMLKRYVLKHVLPKRSRSISQDERLRKVLSQFNTKMIQNQSVGSGKTLRQDCFFSTKINKRSAAEEIFEGVLIAAQLEHEEKKIKLRLTSLLTLLIIPV
jgi:hypothetical protein